MKRMFLPLATLKVAKMYPREMNSLQDVRIGQERENGLSRTLSFLGVFCAHLIAGRSAAFVTLRMPKRIALSAIRRDAHGIEVVCRTNSETVPTGEVGETDRTL
jgi:hypothetical protein